MSFKITNIKKPTPDKWDRIGKGLLRASIYISGYSMVFNYPTFAIIVLSIGGVGEVMTNFFADDDQKSPSAQ